jgi:hypothetical protein
MGIFKDVTLTWDGEDYTVPASGVMRLIAKIEDIITLQELHDPTGIKLSRVSEAYAVALGVAGCKVSIEDVYGWLLSEDAEAVIPAAVNGLMMMMVPPVEYQPDLGKQKTPPKKKPKKPKKG